MPLEEEKALYLELKPSLLEHHKGQFALIVGDDLVGTYDRRDDAYRAGVERFGNTPMLIQLIQEEDSVESLPALTLGLIGANK